MTTRIGRRCRHVGMAASIAVLGFAASAHANEPDRRGVFLLNTGCITVKDPFKGAAAPSEMTGSGVFDPSVASVTMPEGSQRLFFAYNDTGAWRRNSGIVPRYGIVDLTKDGLSVVKKDSWLGSAQWNKDRLFMKPVIAALPGDAHSPGYFFLTGASEDNGTSNNPRTTALLYDANGNAVLNILGTSASGETYGERGERGVDIGAIAGRANGQQQGASAVYYLGKEGDAYKIAISFQENNQRAFVALYLLRITNPTSTDPKVPGATLTAIADAQLLQGEARHNRPTCAVVPGANQAEIACASVHANEQPAEKGITVGRFDTKTGLLLDAKDVIVPSPTDGLTAPGVQEGKVVVPKGYRFAQSLIECVDASCSAYALETSHVMKSQRRNGNNGHTPGTHATDVLVIARDLNVSSFATLGNLPHAHLVPVAYGPGDGKPAVGVLSSTLSGMKPAMLQVLPIDMGGQKIAEALPEHRYGVSAFTNVGDLVARGLNNPQNQGRGFLGAWGNVPNPGANGGWFAGITAFTAVPIPTLNSGSDFMGLDLCFVPSRWFSEYKTAPGSVVRWDQVPVGAPPDPENPNVEPGTGTGPSGGATDYNRTSGESGCSAAPTGDKSAWPLALGFVALVASRVVRRRKGA